MRSLLTRLRNSAFAPVDIASLVFFRIAFGLCMIWHVRWFFLHNRIGHYFLEPRFSFKYYGFEWVQPWPGNGLYIHWALLGVFALFITVGFLYRTSALLFCVGYTYTFLLDSALWVNHRYLICLISFLLIFVPAHRAFSIDAWFTPDLKSDKAPAWSLWLLRLQMGVVYFYGGIAKIMPDWLHGEPMRVWLARNTKFPVIGQFFREEWAVYSFSYGALLFDLFIVPLLLWRRTRAVAFCAAVGFHLLNARMFYIGIFPWLAIVATTLFLSPSWPRRVLSIFWKQPVPETTSPLKPLRPVYEWLVLGFVLLYGAIQILVPLRPFWQRGGIEWMQAEHRFCWRMMLIAKWDHAYFYVTDPNTGQTYQAVPEDFLAAWQAGRMHWRPDMLVQFAHFLATVMPREGLKPLRVEARVLVGLNGRKPRLFINQNVDLAAEKVTLRRPPWLLEIHEPLPYPPADPMQNPFEEGAKDLY